MNIDVSQLKQTDIARVLRELLRLAPIKELSDDEIVALPAGQWERVEGSLDDALLYVSGSRVETIIGQLYDQKKTRPEIAETLNRLGMRTRRGNPWSAKAVTSRITTLEGRRAMQKGTP